jgi:hypothetical protein
MFYPEESEAPTFNDRLRQFAGVYGEERPEQAWLLSDQDVWVANPYYTGPAEPHPESVEY